MEKNDAFPESILSNGTDRVTVRTRDRRVIAKNPQFRCLPE